MSIKGFQRMLKSSTFAFQLLDELFTDHRMNKTGEAYTENRIGRRVSAHLRVGIAST